MENSIALSFISKNLLHLTVAEEIRKYSDCPSLEEVLSLICNHSGMPSADVWGQVVLARQKAQLVVRNLAKSPEKIFVIDFWSVHYPSKIKDSTTPPWVIYFRGELPRAVPSLGVVGSRNPTNYGIEVLAKLVPRLKTDPLQMISGLAYGIDSIAHDLGLRCGIPNFAILASGVDVIYPREHVNLAHSILDNGGGLMSEHPPTTRPLRAHFPQRNRIISALSDIIWVVQASHKSGTRHTVKHAIAQGKEVAATPGDIFSDLSSFPNELIRDGAHLVQCAKDLDSLLVFK